MEEKLFALKAGWAAGIVPGFSHEASAELPPDCPVLRIFSNRMTVASASPPARCLFIIGNFQIPAKFSQTVPGQSGKNFAAQADRTKFFGIQLKTADFQLMLDK